MITQLIRLRGLASTDLGPRVDKHNLQPNDAFCFFCPSFYILLLALITSWVLTYRVFVGPCLVWHHWWRLHRWPFRVHTSHLAASCVIIDSYVHVLRHIYILILSPSPMIEERRVMSLNQSPVFITLCPPRSRGDVIVRKFDRLIKQASMFLLESYNVHVCQLALAVGAIEPVFEKRGER